MVALPELYGLAEKQNIPILRYPLPENGSMSLQLPGGAQERVHLSHELGHCLTGSFYSVYTAVDCRQRHENRADKWAVRKLIPVEQLDDAVAGGCTELWELADRFGVTEDLMRKAVCLYVHGNLAAELYF